MNAYKNKKEKLKDALLFQISSGILKIGDRIPPERVFCQENNLSRVTVRSALAELEQEKIIEKRGRRGVFVAAKPAPWTANTPKNRALKILYIFFPTQTEGLDVNTVAFSSIFRGIDKYVNARKDIAMLLQGESFMRCTEEEKRSYDGFIVGGTSLQRHLPDILQLGIPVVAAAAFTPGIEVDSVSIDFYEGGYVAAKHLAMEGCRKLLFLGIKYKQDKFIPQPIIGEKFRGITDYCIMNDIETPISYDVASEGGQPVLERPEHRKLVGIIKDRNIDGIISCGGNLRQVINGLKTDLAAKNLPLPRIAVFNDGTGNMAGNEYIQINKDLDRCGFCAAELLYDRMKIPSAGFVKKLIPVKRPL